MRRFDHSGPAMKYRTLPGTQLKISEVCLGSMTWGQQNSEAEAHAQLDYAVAQGINFIDTAEMYPIPPNGRTQGRTETIVGHWLARQPPDGLAIATKAAGPAPPRRVSAAPPDVPPHGAP